MFKDSPYYTFSFSNHWLNSREGYYSIERAVFHLDESGVIWQMIYTLTSNEIPREVIDAYNKRLSEQTPE
jgi:hypothetical protein